MENDLNVDRMMKVLSEILSKKDGCKVTITAVPKEKQGAAGTEQKAS